MAEKTSFRQICHECGAAMAWGVKPMTINVKTNSITFEMPGWYCACGEGIVTAQDMEVSDWHLNLLKEQVKNADSTKNGGDGSARWQD